MPDSPKPEQILGYFDNLCETGKSLVWLSTISRGNTPHIVPTCFVKPLGGDKIGIGAVFIKQSVENILRNKQVALASSKFDQGYDGYMIRGTAYIEEHGEQFQRMKDLVLKQTNGKRMIKWLIVVTIKEVYSLKPRKGSKRVEFRE